MKFNRSVLKNRTTAKLLLLIGLTLAAYYPAINAGILLDDKHFYIEDSVMIAPNGLKRIWFDPFDNNQVWPYIPISRTTFWLERQIFGLNLRVSHGINVLLHLGTALLLWGGFTAITISCRMADCNPLCPSPDLCPIGGLACRTEKSGRRGFLLADLMGISHL